MKRYICPVCEHELTAKSYCPECRKVIRKPWVYDGFLPNEYRGDQLRHHEGLHPDRACIEPNKSRVCETPQEARQNQQFTNMQSSQTVYKRYEGNVSTAPGSQIWRTTGSDTYRGNTRRDSSSGSGKNAKKVGLGCGCGCLVIVLVFVSILISALFTLEANVDDLFELLENGGLFGDLQTADYDTIMEAGVACNGSGHFALGGKELHDELILFAEQEVGLVMTGTEEMMYNNTYPGKAGEPLTFYNLYRDWHWANGYFDVDSDTVTDELHCISIYGYDPEEVSQLSVYVLERMDVECVDEIRNWFATVSPDEEGFVGENYSLDKITVSCGRYGLDDYYYFDIYAKHEETELID